MNAPRVSDREKVSLRGPVKTIVDEYSSTVFDEDGKTVEWSGNTMHGHVVRTFHYDKNERLVRVTGNNNDHEDEFRYDGLLKTQIRHIPPRPDAKHRAFGFGAWFDAACEGEMLKDGGAVETKYDERDQPFEKQVVDGEGLILFSAKYAYNPDGRLGSETLTAINFPVPKEIRDQIPIQQRAELLAQMRVEFQQMMRNSGLFGNVERIYVHNERGQIAERHTRMGSNHETLMFSYNERGDISELTRDTLQGPTDKSEQMHFVVKHHRTYEYDSAGNWTSMIETMEWDGKTSSQKHTRQLTYFA